MTRANKLIKLLVFCLFFVAAFVYVPEVSAATRLYFDPANYNTAPNTEFEVKIKIDTDGKNTIGAKATISYPNDLQVTLTNGNFYSHYANPYSQNGLVIVQGYEDAFNVKSGKGDFATLKIRTSKTSGVGSVTFTCEGNYNDTFIYDENFSNVFTCGSNNQLSLTYGATGSTGGSNSNSGGTSGGSSGGSTIGATNACGGTCGSHSNCNAGLFCYNGFCRNPSCSSDTSCTCVATPAPTTKPTTKPAISTPKPLAQNEPEVVQLATFTPYPTLSPLDLASVDESDQAIEEKGTKNVDLKKIALWALILVGAFLFFSALASLFKNRKKPPKITPPSSGGVDFKKTYDVQQTFPSSSDAPTPQPPPEKPSSFQS